MILCSDAIDDPSVGYSAAVLEADDSGSEQVPVDSSDLVGQQHVALVTQEDGTQQQVMESLVWSRKSAQNRTKTISCVTRTSLNKDINLPTNPPWELCSHKNAS